MKINTKTKKILRVSLFSSLILVLIGYFALLSNPTSFIGKIEAYSASCPAGMTAEACLEYLREQAENLASEKNKLNQQITDEEYAQLDLSQKIAYYNNQIAGTEASITELELQIEKNDLEIKLLSEDIEVLENNISTASQEIVQLENSIKKRVGVSYKYSTYSAIEMFMNADEIDVLMRQLQYLKQTGEKDSELLESMSEQRTELSAEQDKLASKKLEVQKTQEDTEAKKTELFDQKTALSGQKVTQQSLLAESKNRQVEYEASLAEVQAIENQVTAQITQLIFQLFEDGQIQTNTPVSKGDIIGLQGNTGISTGSHLHFEFRANGVPQNVNATGCLSVSLWSLAGAGSCAVPVDSGYVTQWPHSGYYAVDLMSYYNGEQPGSYVWGDAISCAGYYIPPGWRSTRGQGAYIRAVKDGMVSNVNTDMCGGKYVIVDHGNGETSLYLHLK